MDYTNIFPFEDCPFKMKALSYDSQEDWEELRTKGVGGSDAGAILGLNKYTTPLDIYKSKVENISKDVSENINVKKGKDLEPIIFTNYVKPYFDKLGYDIYHLQYTLINENYPWLRANLDGIAVAKKDRTYASNIIIEIKYVSHFGAINWENDDELIEGVPKSYYAQVQHYMAVSGSKTAYVCALFEDTWEVKFFKINRNDEFINNLLVVTQAFYNQNMVMKIPPKPTLKDKEVVEEVIDSFATVKSIIPDQEMEDTVSEYLFISNQIKDLDKQKTELSNKIFTLWSEGKTTINKHTIKFSKIVVNRFDSTRFKKDYPDMYKNYISETTSIRSTIK